MRPDDSLAEIGNKLRIFRTRTLPLRRSCGTRQVPLLKLKISAATQAEDLLNGLNARAGISEVTKKSFF